MRPEQNARPIGYVEAIGPSAKSALGAQRSEVTAPRTRARTPPRRGFRPLWLTNSAASACLLGQSVVMTTGGVPTPASIPNVKVRDYTPSDYSACRLLWVELTEHHRRLYEDSAIGGDDAGVGFDDYLATPQRVCSWVAESAGAVVGLTGLFDHGSSGEVEPVVVTDGVRDRGVGRLLIERVVTEAVARGYEYLAIRPVARNVSAIRRFYDAGFQTLGGHVDLTMDLAERRHRWLEGAVLHDLDFRY